MKNFKTNKPNQETKKYYGAQHIEGKITNLLRPLFNSDKNNFLIINNLTKNWHKIVGQKYCKLCEPKSVNFDKSPKKNGEKKSAKLTIAVYNSAVGFFLQNNSDSLLDKISALYGYKAIDRIIIKQEIKDIAHEAKEEIKLDKHKEEALLKSLEKIKDSALKETMMRLGRDIIGRKEHELKNN